MDADIEPIPGITDDPVLRLILSGRAKDLDASLPAVMELIGSNLSNRELENHPLLALLRSRGMRGREDSLL